MKLLIILSILYAQAYGECSLWGIDPVPKPFIVDCNGTSPDKSDFLNSYNENKPFDFVTRFYWKNFKGELNSDMLKTLPKLRHVTVSKCEFTTLPDNFFEADAETLETIEIRDSKITTIEANAFKNLKHLRLLSLHGNKNVKGFKLENLRGCDGLGYIGMPTDTFKTMDVSKLKIWFPKLITIVLPGEDKESVKDKIKEVESQTTGIGIHFEE
ncbi:unnamed protein product [Brassicogethes aeneus]|uniref:Uncharacterized protein n=1 Tax=Brassicogethes aeneus TaxID=1431903 RepID=A0A9P0FNN8_BRAAE|nr:unnamed protein product [Brassicogethes aeneus]